MKMAQSAGMRLWMCLAALPLMTACGDDGPAAADATGTTSADGSDTEGGSTGGVASTSEASSVSTSSSGPDEDTSTGAEQTSTSGESGGESSSTGTVAADIVVHTPGPAQPVVASSADGTLIAWTTSDDEGVAVFDAAEVEMISGLNVNQWTSIVGVEGGDELWLQWRPFPDDTVLGTLEVTMPALATHPTPEEPGFSQVSIGCGETFVGGPAETASFTLDILPECVTASGHVNLVAYAQGGPSIAVVGTAAHLEIDWTAGETTAVALEAWDGTLQDVLFATEDPIEQPVFNTTHTQWIEGVQFPMPRRSSSMGTRLFVADAPVDWLQHTGSTDLGDGPSRMAYAQRRGFDGEDYTLPTPALLTPEITGTTATRVGDRWELTLSSPTPLDDLDGVLLQTRWLGGFWAVMMPAGQTSVVLPELPEALRGNGPGPQDTLDAPFGVAADTDVHEDYAAFRQRGAWFFSGPDIVPDVDENLVRGTVYFPVPFGG